jgi:hypothetical protein
MGAGGAQPHAVALGEREQAAARVVLAGAGVGDVLPAAGADLDLGLDQLAGDRVAEDRVLLAGGAQLLEARDERERDRIEERVLLLDSDREVSRGLEGLARSGEIDQVRSGRSRARRGGRRQGWTCAP